MHELPSGTVTFLFTDIEGSTRLLEEHGGRYAELLEEHRRVLREAFERHGGVEVDTQGDAFFVAFTRAGDAVAAAEEAQRELELPVRMGIHTGEPQLSGDAYVGIDVHRGARICAAGHGGQVVLSQATRDLVDADVIDLALHRLKDVGELRLYQLGGERFPPLRSLNQTNLPLRAEPLLGRKKERAYVVRLLRVDHARLITVTGPGGIGKTSFALEAAAELVEDVSDGVWFVDLSGLRDPALVLATISSTIGARGDLIDYLSSKDVLLVLDNFEQVVKAASQLADILDRAPDLRMLVTSREPLHLRVERTYPLRPLAESPAVELFRHRAEAVDPSFGAPYGQLAELCARLDNLPLALELAAARMGALSVSQLLQRLEERLPVLSARWRDVPERQRTLRATIEWSYDLLAPEEQRLFRRLSVFAGGFDLDAAEQAAYADLDTLESLVEKSLIRKDGERFTMLVTIREFALERLEGSSDSAEMRAGHAAYFRRLAQNADEEIEAAENFTEEHPDEAWFDRLTLDEDNLRAALRALLDGERCDDALLMCFAMRAFWLRRDRAPEGMRWTSEALACRGNVSAVARGSALYAHANLAFFASDFGQAERSATEFLDLARDRGDHVLCSAYGVLGRVARSRGDLSTANTLMENALEHGRKAGDRNAILGCLHQLGEIARDDGDFERGERLLREALAEAHELGRVTAYANTMHSLGDLALDRAAWDEATEWYLESLAIFKDIRARTGVAYCLAGLAAAAAGRKNAVRAGRLWGATVQIEQDLGIPILAFERTRYEKLLNRLRGPKFLAAVERGRALEMAAAIELGQIDR